MLAEARAPKKGKVNLFPQDTLAEMLETQDAKQLIKKRKENDSTELVDVLSEIFLMMPKVLEELKQMVCSLPAREVKQSVLDEEVNKLACVPESAFKA